MNIIIDGQPLATGHISGNNLEEIINDLQQNHLPEDHIIGEVMLNGRPYNEDVPHAAVAVVRTEILSLEIMTITSEAIAGHFIENAGNIVDSLIGALPKITETFRLGDEAEANEHYLRFLESLHLLLTMTESVGHVLGFHFDSALETGSDPMNLHLKKLSEILTSLLSIQEQTDWIYLADILEYELKPELEFFRNVFPQLKRFAH
jgi:hypothetical protein